MSHTISSQLLQNLFADKNVKGGAFTVRSRKTGKDYTFKMSTNVFNEKPYLHVKVETNYMEFQYLGFFSNGKLIRKGVEVESPSATAAAWILRQLEQKQFARIDELVEVFHLGKCLRCGKTLTDANSIEAGFGPYCRANM